MTVAVSRCLYTGFALLAGAWAAPLPGSKPEPCWVAKVNLAKRRRAQSTALVSPGGGTGTCRRVPCRPCAFPALVAVGTQHRRAPALPGGHRGSWDDGGTRSGWESKVPGMRSSDGAWRMERDGGGSGCPSPPVGPSSCFHE